MTGDVRDHLDAFKCFSQMFWQTPRCNFCCHSVGQLIIVQPTPRDSCLVSSMQKWDTRHFMYALVMLIDQIINLYIWSLLAYLVIGWLVAFRIVNPWQPAVRMINDLLARLHEPLLQPIRRVLPDLGAIDISPIILFLAAQFLRNLLYSFTVG